MSTIQYTPSGVCCRQMEIEVEGDTLKSVIFYGGCDGNLQGVSRLVAGRKIDEVVATLQGIDCRGKGTSCPDQLSRALLSIKK
ncbi:MAG: TIGR03905 family TSCPD domain-containing protein [Rikenellaceae bacterium]